MVDVTDAWRAGGLLAHVLGSVETAEQVGPSLTCSEVDELAHALLLLGQAQAAVTLLSCHAEGPDEDEGDRHLALGVENGAASIRAVTRYLRAQFGICPACGTRGGGCPAACDLVTSEGR